MKSLIFIIIASVIYAKDIAPEYILHTQGFINDFVIEDAKVYIATDKGSVDIFDAREKKFVLQILIEPFVNVHGEEVPASISSVDVHKGKVLIVSSEKDNYRSLWLYDKGSLHHLISSARKLLIKKARFIDENRIVLATIDSDLIVYDMQEKYSVYHKHVSESTLGDMTLSEDNKEIITAHESGEVKTFDLSSGIEKGEPLSKNVDNIFHVAHSNGRTITAGEDRRVAVYQEGQEAYYIQSSFLVYCVGISPSGEIGVYTEGEENVLQVFDTYSKQMKERLIGHKRIVNQIHFIDEDTIVSSEQGNSLYFWSLRQ